jgi:hypothetical protein
VSSIRARLAEIAIKQVGTVEIGGNNRGPKIREYQAATSLAPDDWPWCAAFACWCVRSWLDDLGHDAPFSRLARPITPAAFGLEKWAKQNGFLILGESARCEAGDLVVYDMSHCGIVVATAPAGSKHIEAVEGNTGPTGLRDSNMGDGVYRKKRLRTMVRSFIRLERPEKKAA